MIFLRLNSFFLQIFKERLDNFFLLLYFGTVVRKILNLGNNLLLCRLLFLFNTGFGTVKHSFIDGLLFNFDHFIVEVVVFVTLFRKYSISFFQPIKLLNYFACILMFRFKIVEFGFFFGCFNTYTDNHLFSLYKVVFVIVGRYIWLDEL